MPVSSCSAPIGQVDSHAALRQLGLQLAERAEEVGALPVEHVHEHEAGEAELVGELPRTSGAHLDAHDAAHAEERSLDHP